MKTKLQELISEFIDGWTKWNLYDHGKKEYFELDLDDTHIKQMKVDLQAIIDEARKDQKKLIFKNQQKWGILPESRLYISIN